MKVRQLTKPVFLMRRTLVLNNIFSVIVIIILVITFMQGMYNYIPETNHVSWVYSVAVILYRQFVLHVMLFRPRKVLCVYNSTFRSIYGPIWLSFCSSLISCFPVLLLRYCLSDFEIVPVALLITGIAFAFTFHMR